jgi:hypothetical protein
MSKEKVRSAEPCGAAVNDPLTLAILAASWWWSGWVSLLWPSAMRRHIVCENGHCQLILPDPIEDDGEHALFA